MLFIWIEIYYLEFKLCSEYIDYHGNAYAGVIKMNIKVHSNGAVKEPIPEKYEQIQPFTKENVDYHPGYDLDSNFKKLIWISYLTSTMS